MTDIKKEITPEEAWQRLYDFAQSCINWGEGDIDKEKFFDYGKDLFIIELAE